MPTRDLPFRLFVAVRRTSGISELFRVDAVKFARSPLSALLGSPMVSDSCRLKLKSSFPFEEMLLAMRGVVENS